MPLDTIVSKDKEVLQNSVNALLGELKSEKSQKLVTNYLRFVHQVLKARPEIIPKISYEPLQQYIGQNNEFPAVALKILRLSGESSSSNKPLKTKTKYEFKPEELDLEKLRAGRRARKLMKKQAKLSQRLERQERKNNLFVLDTIDEDNKVIDIIAKGKYPANILSNYNRDDIPFYVDGVPCHSIEGLLQAIKQPDAEVQKQLCLLSGSKARRAGQQYNDCWKANQTLYWRGETYPRNSEKYQKFLKKVFNARFSQSEKFRQALMDTKGYTLTHKCGYNNPNLSVLTENEFIAILDELRNNN